MSQPDRQSRIPKDSTEATNNVNKEPFPPTPPVLKDHPYIRILQYCGFGENDFDPANRHFTLCTPSPSTTSMASTSSSAT